MTNYYDYGYDYDQFTAQNSYEISRPQYSHYGYDQYMFPYQNSYESPRPQYSHSSHYPQQHYTQGQGATMYLITPKTINDHLNAGRRGHCFSSFWGGREHTLYL